MKRLVASLAVVALLTLTLAPPAAAGSSTDAALALGAFAVFNQIIRGDTIFHDLGGRRARVRETVRETVIVQQPAVVYAPPPPAVVYAPPPPPPPPPPEVHYPHGKWVFEYGQWVWIPNQPHYRHYRGQGYGHDRWDR